MPFVLSDRFSSTDAEGRMNRHGEMADTIATKKRGPYSFPSVQSEIHSVPAPSGLPLENPLASDSTYGELFPDNSCGFSTICPRVFSRDECPCTSRKPKSDIL